ncbi:MAG: TetR/AcrR family transcriptional regulator [Bacteroidales bacterium]|nr:TetR/AcrR family transcriptional regulator [Bacteroidales bacterium]
MDYRQRIIEDAALMFRTYGLRAVTMDMLANHMGISKRTIYEVFKDKDELLRGVLRWMAVRQREVMTKILNESENVIEAIFKMLDLMRDHFQNMSPAFQMDMKRHHHDVMKKLDELNELPYINNNSEIIERGIREGVFRKDIDVEIINKCMLEVARMSNDKSVFPPDDFLNKDVIRNFYLNYLRGISTQKGLDLINFHEKKK